MGQEEPEKIEPDGEDPGTTFTEGLEGEGFGDAVELQGDPEPEPEPQPEIKPEGEDPGRIETFDLKPEGEERLHPSEEK